MGGRITDYGRLLFGNPMKTLLLIWLFVAPSQLTALFTQTRHSPLLTQDQVSHGRMEYRAPDYLRWEYTDPQAVVWLLDGRHSNMRPEARRMVQMILKMVRGEVNTDNAKAFQPYFQHVQVTLNSDSLAQQIILTNHDEWTRIDLIYVP